MLEKGMDLDMFIYNRLYEKSKDVANEWSDASPIVASRGIRNDMVSLNQYIGEVLLQQVRPDPSDLKKLMSVVDSDAYVKKVDSILIPTILKHKVKFTIE